MLLYIQKFASTVKKAISTFFVLLATILLPVIASAQDSGGQDSTGLVGGPGLRPRRDSYIIVPFPSPARHGVTMHIQIYNHFAEQISVRIVDMLDKTIATLQSQGNLDNGIHSYDFNTSTVSTGTYFIRMTTYSSTGAQNLVQDTRFQVLH